MALATGEILTWLNADDLLPGAYSMALAFETSKADLVAGMAHVYRDGRVVDYHHQREPGPFAPRNC